MRRRRPSQRLSKGVHGYARSFHTPPLNRPVLGLAKGKALRAILSHPTPRPSRLLTAKPKAKHSSTTGAHTAVRTAKLLRTSHWLSHRPPSAGGPRHCLSVKPQAPPALGQRASRALRQRRPRHCQAIGPPPRWRLSMGSRRPGGSSHWPSHRSAHRREGRAPPRPRHWPGHWQSKGPLFNQSFLHHRPIHRPRVQPQAYPALAQRTILSRPTPPPPRIRASERQSYKIKLFPFHGVTMARL